MHLSQHQFQLQSRFHQDVTEFILSSLNPHATGLIDCRFDEDALRNGVVSILHARGVMPDGLVFRFPEDPAPDALDIREHFSPTAQSHLLLLSIPAWIDGRASCSDPGRNGTSTRYVTSEQQLPDETTGLDPKTVHLAQKNFRIVLDTQIPDDAVTLPIARLTRDGSGNFVYDPEFVPPCVRIGASARLLTELQRLVEMLESKATALASERAAGGDGDGAAEIVNFWLSHTLQSAIPPLRHHLRLRKSHPEQLFMELSRLAGALCTFSMDASASELPNYDHADPESCFAEVLHHVRRHLDVVVAEGAHVVRLVPGKPNFLSGVVPDERAYAKTSWYLAVRSSMPRDELATGVPRLVKVCSDKHIERLVQEAFPGLALHSVPHPPAGLKPRPGVQYFRMERTDPCWASIVQTRQVGVYVPDSISQTDVSIHVLTLD